MSGDVIGWVPVYDADGIPTEMRYDFRELEPSQRGCPKTWPHSRHHWSTGDVVSACDVHRVSFDCPGLPMVTTSGKTVIL